MALEAGAPGVDAAAVTAALVGLTESPAEGAEPVTADGRPLLFAHLTYDDLQKAAAAAPEGSTLFDANAAVTAATEAHAASEDPDKGEFFVTTALIAGLFAAFAETDATTYRESVTARRTLAFEAATAAHDAAAAAAAAEEEEAAAAREAFETQAREHKAMMDAWNQEDEEDDGPGPGPDPDVVADAEEKLNLAKDAATTARRAVASAARARASPAEATKVYVLGDDFFSGVDGAEATPENAVSRLADLAAAGLPVKGLVNLARARAEFSRRDEHVGSVETDGTEPAAEEEDDPVPPMCAALMDAHERATLNSLEFDAPARLVAVVPLDFPRGEDLDAAALASSTAAKCGVVALAADEYARWRAEADVVRVPRDYAATVTDALARAKAEEARARSEETDAADAAEVSAETEVSSEADAEAKEKATKPTLGREKTAMDFVEHRAYTQMLAGIPHERLTCAVILDAMIGQTCASACDPEDVKRASDVAAAEAARVAVSAALETLKLEHVPSLERSTLGAPLSSRGASRFGFGTARSATPAFGGASTASTTFLIREGDPLFPDGDVPDPLDEPDPLDGARVTLLHAGDTAGALRSTRAPGAFAATLAARPTMASVVKLDPDLVEAKMASLAHAPGVRRAGMPPAPEMDDDARGARKTALAAFLCPPTAPLVSASDAKATLAAAERRELMLEVANRALPEGCRDDFFDEVLERRHWEPLTREAYAATIGTCVSCTGALAITSAYHAAEDALLVTCHAAPHEERMDEAPYRVNRASPWCEFFGVYAASYAALLESRARRDARDAERAKRAADDEARRLETEASDLAALDPAARAAREASDAEARREAEAARRAAEEEEAAAWAWDGSEDEGEDAVEDGEERRDGKKSSSEGSEGDPSEPDEDGRRWVVDADGSRRRRRAKIVPMASIAYSVEAEASVACAGWTRRLYPSANGAAVVASPDGGVDVVVAAVRLGLRRSGGAGDGDGGCLLVASLADQPGAAVVVGRAPADPPPPPPPRAEGETEGEGEGASPDATPERVSEETPAEEEDSNAEPEPTKEKPVYVQYTSDAGLCVTATTERVVMQSRVDALGSVSSAAGARPASLPGSIDVDADVETVRAILPDGSTVRHTRDGGAEVLRADGNVAKRDVRDGAWIGTNARGIRWAQRDPYVYVPPPPPSEEESEGEKANAEANETDETSHTTEPSGPTSVPLSAGDVVTPPPTFVRPLSAATVIDPETRAKVTSREDLTLVVEHPDAASGSRSLAVHADGTRVCRDVPAGCLWRVEKEGFAPTHADAVTRDIAADLGVGSVSVDADGVACATFGTNGSLGAVCADVAGLVAFVPGDDGEGNTSDGLSPLARAKRALRAAATPEGERRGVGDIGAGDPDVDGAFIFDLRRGALRFVDEAARRKEIGFVPFRKEKSASLEAEPSVGGASVATDDGLGPSASRACVGDDQDADPDPELSGEKEIKPATPAAFVARAHEFRAACAFAELDPPPPPPPPEEEEEEGTEEGEEGGTDEHKNAGGEDEKTPSPEEAAAAAAAASPVGENSPVAAEPSSATTATLATTVIVDEPPPVVVVKAPLVPPRVFVAYPDQDEYFEVLSERAFASYRAERLADASCAADAAPVAGAEAGSGAVSHTFLTPLRPAPAPPAPTHVPVPSARLPTIPKDGPRAVPSLRTPSVPQFPAAPATLLVPRIAAVDETTLIGKDVANVSKNVFVFRQIIEYPKLSDASKRAVDEALRNEADASLEMTRVAPESYLLRDVRSDAFLVAEQNLADRVVAARRSKEAAYAAARAEALAAEAEEARRLAEEALDLGIYTLAREAKVAPRGGPAPPRGPRPAFPPVSFFDVEEGREALRAIEQAETKALSIGEETMSRGEGSVRDRIPPYSDRRTLPPRRASRAVDPLPPSVRLADPEPPPPRTRDAFEDDEHMFAAENRLDDVDDDVPASFSAFGSARPSLFSTSVSREEDFSGDRTFRTEARVDFTGKRRPFAAAPASYYREKAPFVCNAAHEDVEGNARRRLRTSSTTLAETRRLEKRRDERHHPGPAAQFELSPAHVHFGRVMPGVAVKRRATLTNVSSDLGRFSVRQPSSSAFAIEYVPGMVSPGLAAQLRVVCRATRPGEYVGEATILTESQVFVLSLSAVVVGNGDAENVLPNHDR